MLIGAVSWYRNQFQRGQIVGSIRAAQWMVFVLPLFSGPGELQVVVYSTYYLYVYGTVKYIALSLAVFVMFLVNGLYLSAADMRYKNCCVLVSAIAAVAVLVDTLLGSELPIALGSTSAVRIVIWITTGLAAVAVLALFVW